MLMLKVLSALAKADGFIPISGLANSLDLSPNGTRAMLDDLARMGYLEQSEERCASGACGSSCSGCAAATGSRGWVLSDKGSRFVARARDEGDL